MFHGVKTVRTTRTQAEVMGTSPAGFDGVDANDQASAAGYAPSPGRPAPRHSRATPDPQVRAGSQAVQTGFSLATYSSSSGNSMVDANGGYGYCNVDPGESPDTTSSFPAGPQQTPFRLGPQLKAF